MTTNANARVKANAESLGGKYDFYTVRTTVPMAEGAVGSPEQVRLDTLNQTIQLRGQTVIFACYDAEQVVDPDGFPAGTHDVVRVNFIIEHHLSWGDDKDSIEKNLKEALVATGQFTDDDVVVDVRVRL